MGLSSDPTLLTNQVYNYELPESYEEYKDVFDVEYRKLVDSVNSKEGALYLLQELATFQRYYIAGNPIKTINVYRKTFNFGSLPNATSKKLPHGIRMDANTKLTRLYGAATDPASRQFIPLPFASPTLANNVSLEANGTEIIVTTGSSRINFTQTSIVMEYTKG